MYTIINIAKLLNGKVIGSKSRLIVGVCELSVIKNNHIAFLLTNKNKNLLTNKVNQLSALVVSNDFDNDIDTTLIKVDNPKKVLQKYLIYLIKRKHIKKKFIKVVLFIKHQLLVQMFV